MNTPLSSRIRAFLSREGGFGMLEVLAVMVVVGLLAAIAIPQFTKHREQAAVTTMESDLRNAGSAMEAAASDEGEYPDSLAGIFTPSKNTTVRVAGAAIAPLPDSLGHLRLADAPSAQVVKGVTIAVEPVGSSTLQVKVSCPSSVPNGLQTLRCTGNDSAEFILWADASPGPAPQMVCQSSGGAMYQQVAAMSNSNVSVRTTRDQAPGYVTNGPISVVTGSATCSGGDKAVGWSYNGASLSNTYVNRKFQMAWGNTASASVPEGDKGDGLCLQAESTKTEKVRSWTPAAGLAKTAC